jgi:hypothetical protein
MNAQRHAGLTRSLTLIRGPPTPLQFCANAEATGRSAGNKIALPGESERAAGAAAIEST